MTINSISLAQNLVTTNRQQNKINNVTFKGENVPDLDALRAKQDEFKRMSERSEQGGAVSKLGSFASKAIGVLIAFTATKICLGKAAEMFTDGISKFTDKTLLKFEERAKSKAQKAIENLSEEKAVEVTKQIMAKSDKLKNAVDKFRQFDILGKIINVIAGGAAVGVAMKDFGLVNKQVSNNAEHLVDKAIDKANGNDYNSNVDEDFSSVEESDEDSDIDVESNPTKDDYTVSEDEF